MQARAKAQKLRVRDVFDIDKSLAVVVPEETPFAEVVRTFAGRTDLRGIFVVDRHQRLVGVITRQDLLHWAAEKLHVQDPERHAWRDLYRVMTAATAKQACRAKSDQCAVRPDTPLERVLILMFQNELIDIPVVDDDGRIVGDIRLTEILRKVIDEKPG